MWFKRKAKNRHLQRPQVLNVKLRASQVRAGRFRLAALALSISFGTLFLLFVVWRGGEWLLNRLIYENEAFAIQQIDVQTDGIIATEQLRRWARVRADENLLALDLARVKRDLELVPLIESVAVERILPHTLKVRIVERVPVAQTQTMQWRKEGGAEEALYQLDESGFVMPPLDIRFCSRPPDISSELLPVISGINARELRPGRKIESDQLRAALQLIDAFNHSSMAGMADLQRIDISAPEVLRVYTSQQSEVVFSLGQFEKQLHRWHLVYEQSQKWNKAIGMLDLSIANNIPLRLVEAFPTSPVHSKPLKPSRKKKHV